nr:hypothetical protein [Amycolatopsis orientalis]
MSGARIEETPLRTRIALSVGALLLAAGAALTGTSLAAADQAPTTTQPAPAPPTAKPTGNPTAAPMPTTAPPRAEPTPGQKTRPAVEKPGEHRVPKAVPAGPTGDLNLPAVVEGAGN